MCSPLSYVVSLPSAVPHCGCFSNQQSAGNAKSVSVSELSWLRLTVPLALFLHTSAKPWRKSSISEATLFTQQKSFCLFPFTCCSFQPKQNEDLRYEFTFDSFPCSEPSPNSCPWWAGRLRPQCQDNHTCEWAGVLQTPLRAPLSLKSTLYETGVRKIQTYRVLHNSKQTNKQMIPTKSRQ